MHSPFRLLPLLFALVLVACSGSAAGLPPGGAEASPSLARPSLGVKPMPSGVAADYSGVLSMDSVEGGCPFLDAPDGKKLQVIYPDGWQLDKSPLQLLAPDGSIHAKAGDVVAIKGSEANDMATTCQIGPVIRATEVLPN
jgi:hypothetical protein